jgi:hypothetical protein
LNLIFAYKNQAFFPLQKKVAKKIAGIHSPTAPFLAFSCLFNAFSRLFIEIKCS